MPQLPSSQPTVLLTGFEAFGGETVNPSWLLAQALDGQVIEGHRVVARLLPCVFGQALQVLDRALHEVRPSLVLALGQAAGRSELSLERVAINVDDARIADNAGARPVDTPVVRGAPAAYFSTLPIKAMTAAVRAAGLPAAVSQTAGTFVCNHVFFGLQHALAGSLVRSGFMHIPMLPEQAARHAQMASMSLSCMSQGLRLALQVALQVKQDLQVADGAIA